MRRRKKTGQGFIILLVAIAMVAVAVVFAYSVLDKIVIPPIDQPPVEEPVDPVEPVEPDEPTEPEEPTEPVEPVEPIEPQKDVYAYTVSEVGVVITGRGTVESRALVIPSEIEGKKVISIAEGAFKRDEANSIKIPSTVSWIGANAFENCVNMVQIVIPASVQYMGDSVFFGCTELDYIYIEAKEKPTGWSNDWRKGYGGWTYWGGDWHYKESGAPIGNDVIELPVIPFGTFEAQGTYSDELSWEEL